MCALSHYTNDCTSKDSSVKLLKFADDTTLISLIQNGDKSGCLVQSQQPGAEHAQNCGDDSGLKEKHCSTPSSHHHEEHCDCSGVIQIPGHHHLSGPEVGHSH